jgi:hypothetical protein
MQINFKRPFVNFVKKSKKPFQLIIEDKIDFIKSNPNSGERKIADLTDIYVYKFNFNKQLFLIAYKFKMALGSLEIIWIDFYKIGSHENFYKELKLFLKKEINSYGATQLRRVK